MAANELPGNEYHDAYKALLADGQACPDPAAALEAISPLLVTAIVGALAFEQRTANLIALFSLENVSDLNYGYLRRQIIDRLGKDGLEVPNDTPF